MCVHNSRTTILTLSQGEAQSPNYRIIEGMVGMNLCNQKMWIVTTGTLVSDPVCGLDFLLDELLLVDSKIEVSNAGQHNS